MNDENDQVNQNQPYLWVKISSNIGTTVIYIQFIRMTTCKGYCVKYKEISTFHIDTVIIIVLISNFTLCAKRKCPEGKLNA